MKAIEPDAIPELRWMPWILGGLIAVGLVVVAIGRRLPLYLWGAALVALYAIAQFLGWTKDFASRPNRIETCQQSAIEVSPKRP
mgnify:CR=1 FL=1